MRTEENEEGQQKWGSHSVHEILMIVLPYLHSLFELFSMAGVSRAFRNAVREEHSLWTKVVVEAPLSSRLTDDILWELTSISAGKLEILGLRKCLRITDRGLRRVIDANPLIKKLHVAGCTGLTPEGIIDCVVHMTKENQNLESLHINGVPGITDEHLAILSAYLPKEGAVDLEICPKCTEVRMIPPCSRKSCKLERNERNCRGCWYCVLRCMECGVCLEPDAEIDETACGGDVVCRECWLKLPKCQFCNKPYCTKHSSLRQNIATTDPEAKPMFVCQDCHFRAGTSSAHDAVGHQI